MLSANKKEGKKVSNGNTNDFIPTGALLLTSGNRGWRRMIWFYQWLLEK